MTTYHAALIGLMLVGGFGIFVIFLRHERMWRDRQPLTDDMNIWARQRYIGGLHSAAGIVLGLVFAGALWLLW